MRLAITDNSITKNIRWLSFIARVLEAYSGAAGCSLSHSVSALLIAITPAEKIYTIEGRPIGAG